MSFKMMTKKIEGFAGVDNIVELDGLVFNITSIKKNISSGVCYTEMECEHVSYMLNDDGYKVTAFDMEGTPRQILQYLLAGTPFYVGTVDMETTVTLRVNTETTRRACVMQLVALVKGEIEYYGYSPLRISGLFCETSPTAAQEGQTSQPFLTVILEKAS